MPGQNADSAPDLPLTFRPITDEDLPFLARLYASTRAQEMAMVPWSDEQKAAFLEQQFEAQHVHYQKNFRKAELSLIEHEGQPVGRLYVDRREKEIRLVDIALVPEARNRGWGSRLLRRVMAEGEEKGLPVSIHVEQFNPALRLYERLGFRQIEEQGPYYLMEWRAPEGRP